MGSASILLALAGMLPASHVAIRLFRFRFVSFPEMTPIQIKLCGVTNVNDARMCAELGADMIGFNFYPQSPRYIEPKIARQLVEMLPTNTLPVGVFVDGNAGEILKSANAAGVRCVQLHGDFSSEDGRELAREFRVIQVFSTHPQFRPEDVALFSHCDVLVDAHHPDLRGGTGQTCDWSAARATFPFSRFLILSGGLNAENVVSAITAVTPHAVDVCSGVERAPGVKIATLSTISSLPCARQNAPWQRHQFLYDVLKQLGHCHR